MSSTYGTGSPERCRQSGVPRCSAHRGDGCYVVNLLPVVNSVLSTLDQKAPTLLGKQVALPELTSGTVPANLRTRVESALGVQLPEDSANVTI